MRTAVIIDIAVAVVLLAFLLGGARRGLFRTVAGVAAVVAALAGASYAADCLTPMAEQSVRPYLEQRVQERVKKSLAAEKMSDSQVESAQSEPPGTEILRALGRMRLDQDASNPIAKAAEQKMKKTGASIQAALEESFSETILHTALFALCFLLLMLLFKLLVHTLNQVMKLPGLNFLNRLGGAALGILEGAILLFVAVWVLRRFGISFETKTVEETVLLRFFTANTPLGVLSFL